MNLVTGATGHIGNVLIRHLLAMQKPVRAMILPGEDTRPLEGLEIEQVEADVLDYHSLMKAFHDVDRIYHLAGLISIMPGKDPLVESVNVLGTRNVIHAARQSKIHRLIYTSSIHAFKRIPHGITIDEKVPFDPIGAISAYDGSKAQASLEVLQAIHEGLDAVIACPTGVIGPFDYRESEMGQIILDCLKGKPFFYVDGVYDFVDVRDVADGLVRIAENGRTGETYILSGNRVGIKEIAETVQQVAGRHFPKIKIPFSLARLASHLTPIYYRLSKSKPRFTPYALETIQSNSMISHEKAKLELGYQPRPLRLSLVETIAWFMQQSTFTKIPTLLPL